MIRLALVPLLCLLGSGCAAEERRMRHHYLHEKGIPHSHAVGEEPDPGGQQGSGYDWREVRR